MNHEKAGSVMIYAFCLFSVIEKCPHVVRSQQESAKTILESQAAEPDFVILTEKEEALFTDLQRVINESAYIENVKIQDTMS